MNNIELFNDVLEVVHSQQFDPPTPKTKEFIYVCRDCGAQNDYWTKLCRDCDDESQSQQLEADQDV